MNALTATLVWCAVQVTVLSALFAAAYFVLGRRSRAAAASLLAAGFGAVAVATAFCFSPWPRWCTLADVARLGDGAGDDTTAPQEASGDADDAPHPESVKRSGSQAATPLRPNAAQADRATAGLWGYVTDFVDGLREVQVPSAEQRGWSWLSIIGGALAVAASLLVLRLLCGVWLVARCLRRSTVVDDAALVGVLNECRREMFVDKPVVLRSSPQITTPATVGWRKPVILLPVTWREWSSEELHAVVAHELAHVQRGDFATGVLAELVRAVHFYHPLVHWLAARLRLDQELAADSMAAAFAGGPRCYLGSLARLAIREDDRPLGRLMQPFLPGAGTLTRRIDMLRSKRSEPHGRPVRRPTRVVLGALAALAAIAVAGVRLPARGNPLAPPPSQANEQAKRKLDLRYLSPEAPPVMLLAVRPAELLERGDVKKLLESAGPLAQEGLASFEQFAGVPLAQVEELLVVQLRHGEGTTQGFILHTTKPYDREKVLAALVTRPTEAEYRGKGFFKATSERLLSVYLPDERTIVAAPEDQLRPMMTAVPGDASKLLLVEALGNVNQDGDLLVAVDSVMLLETFGGQADRNPVSQPLAALWQKTTSFAASASIEEGSPTQLAILCLDEASTESVQTAMQAAIGLAKAGLDTLRQQPLEVPPGDDPEIVRKFFEGSAKLLQTIQSHREGNAVYFETKSSFDAPVALAFVLPAVARAREAARRVQCQSNLRQIALAMHEYADLHGSLPPVAVYDKNGKPMHSWRVLLLPLLGQQELYDRYDMNEPWDGPHNRKLIAEMPEVYRCPSGIHPAGHTDYAVMVGENTTFPPNREKGITLDEIAAGHGTSVTFLVGEISGNPKLSIPWTKPQDVEFSDTSVVPGSPDGFSSRHEGGFNIVTADATAMFVSLRVDPNAFRSLFTRNGGEVGFSF